MTPAAQLRRGRGIPEGGEFASHLRTEDDVELQTMGEATTSRTLLSDSEALLFSRRAVKYWGWKNGAYLSDRDDIAQDAIVSVLSSRSNGAVVGLTPGLISSAAGHAAAKSINTKRVMRAEEARADALLRGQIVDIERAQRRHLSNREIDNMAKIIRDTWPDQRHRPTEGFHRPVERVSFDSDEGQEISEFLAATDSEPATAARELADSVDAGEIDKSTARRRAWNAMSVDSGIPQAAPIADAKSARLAQRNVRDAGGALAVAGAWNDGVRNAGTDALFAPFLVSDDESRKAVVDHLLSRPQVADRLWAATAYASGD